MQAANKPIFQQFVEANQGLIHCYNAVTVEDYKKMSEPNQQKLCASHKSKIKEILETDQMTMTHLIEQRCQILYKLAESVKVQKN